jgi:DNA primase
MSDGQRAPNLRAEADRIKAGTRIVDVIGETVALRRQGRLWTACCPFHGEKTPSFWVYPDHYHCFGFGAHGDLFTWLMSRYRMTFPEAVKRLGGRVVADHELRPSSGRAGPITPAQRAGGPVYVVLEAGHRCARHAR